MNAAPRHHVSILDGPLGEPPPTDPALRDGCGAWVVFEGIVRGREGESVISALDYTAYEPMAQNELTKLAEEIADRESLACIVVEHSRGRVAVGECSFRLSIGSAHRAPAIRAMAEFIDRMKLDIPIWKEPVAQEG